MDTIDHITGHASYPRDLTFKFEATRSQCQSLTTWKSEISSLASASYFFFLVSPFSLFPYLPIVCVHYIAYIFLKGILNCFGNKAAKSVQRWGGGASSHESVLLTVVGWPEQQAIHKYRKLARLMLETLEVPALFIVAFLNKFLNLSCEYVTF